MVFNLYSNKCNHCFKIKDNRWFIPKRKDTNAILHCFYIVYNTLLYLLWLQKNIGISVCASFVTEPSLCIAWNVIYTMAPTGVSTAVFIRFIFTLWKCGCVFLPKKSAITFYEQWWIYDGVPSIYYQSRHSKSLILRE